MKRAIFTILGLFAIAAGVVIALRMSADAMAVIIGIVFGLAATIPTTLILIYTIRQRDAQQLQTRQQMGQYPPVIVVNSTPTGASAGGLGAHSLLPPAGERSFKVVGQEASPVESLGEAFNLSSIWDEGA